MTCAFRRHLPSYSLHWLPGRPCGSPYRHVLEVRHIHQLKKQYGDMVMRNPVTDKMVLGVFSILLRTKVEFEVVVP